MKVIEMGEISQAHAKDDPNLGLVPDTTLPEHGIIIEATQEELKELGPVIFRDVLVTAKDKDVDYKQIARLMASKAFDYSKFTKAIEEVVAEFPADPNVVYKTPAVVLEAISKEMNKC